MRAVIRWSFAIAVAAMVVLAGCSSGHDWTAYNNKRHSYDPAALAQARRVADQINAAGIRCANYANSDFPLLAGSYKKVHLPIPRGSGQCDADQENILIEVFARKPPNGNDFVATKGTLICKRAKKLSGPHSNLPFDGIPYLISPDRSWLIEPDSFNETRKIGAALKLPTKDMCKA